MEDFIHNKIVQAKWVLLNILYILFWHMMYVL